MTSLKQRISAWRNDPLFSRVVKNSAYLFSSSTLSAALGFVQSILSTRLLGIDGYGFVNGVVITFASNINTLFSFRMSEAVVKFYGDALQVDDKPRASALIKGIALTEAGTSILTYFVLLLLTPWAARVLGKDVNTTSLFAFYGLSLIANLIYETSRGVLQTAKRFDTLAKINAIQSLLTFAWIVVAFFNNGGVFDILTAYLAGKFLGGISIATLAFAELKKSLPSGWLGTPLTTVRGWREIISFAFTTNLNGTINLLARDSAPNILAALRPAEVAHLEVGYFRLAMSLMNLAMLPIEPFIWPTYSEITRSINARLWDETRRLLRRVSLLAAAWTLSVGAGLALFGGWLIPFLYKPQAAPVYPAVLILLTGFIVSNIFNWNRPLLLALGKPAIPLVVAALVALVEIILALIFVPRYGYLAQSAVLSFYFSVSVLIMVWVGLREMKKQQAR